jgi:hypothetical protein
MASPLVRDENGGLGVGLADSPGVSREYSQPPVWALKLQKDIDELKQLLGVGRSATPALLKVCEFARLAGVSRWTVQDWIKSRKVRKVRGKIPATELERLR